MQKIRLILEIAEAVNFIVAIPAAFRTCLIIMINL